MNKTKLNNGQSLRFPMSMYNTLHGSVVVCGYLFSTQPVDINEVLRLWHRVEHAAEKGINILDWDLSDKDFIKKTLSYFGLDVPENFPIAFVQDNSTGLNRCLFAPYVDGHLMPLREDGVYGRTLKKGKIYPIDFSNEELKIKEPVND